MQYDFSARRLHFADPSDRYPDAVVGAARVGQKLEDERSISPEDLDPGLMGKIRPRTGDDLSTLEFGVFPSWVSESCLRRISLQSTLLTRESPLKFFTFVETPKLIPSRRRLVITPPLPKIRIIDVLVGQIAFLLP